MRFKNKQPFALNFEFHGAKHVVPEGGEWECPDRLAYAVPLMKLKLDPVGKMPERASSEFAGERADNIFDGDHVMFKNGDEALVFEFHGYMHRVQPGGLWECPQRLAAAVERLQLPLTRVERDASSFDASEEVDESPVSLEASSEPAPADEPKSRTMSRAERREADRAAREAARGESVSRAADEPKPE